MWQHQGLTTEAVWVAHRAWNILLWLLKKKLALAESKRSPRVMVLGCRTFEERIKH